MLKSIDGNFDHAEVNQLLKKHFVELRAASPRGSTHVLDIAGLKVPSIKFWSLWEDSQLMGCGALKFLDKNHGEFKSIRVHDDFRKKASIERIVCSWCIAQRNSFDFLLLGRNDQLGRWGLGVLLGTCLVLLQRYFPFLYVPGTNFPYPVRLEFQNVAMVLLLLLVLGGLASAWATAQVGKKIKLL